MLVLFPSIIHSFKAVNFNQKELIKYCYSEKKKDPIGLTRSNKGSAWHSKDDYMLKDNLVSSVITSSISSYVNENKIFKEGIEYYFRNAWININSKGASNALHNHPLSSLSGVFWVKIPKNSGTIEFQNPSLYIEYAALNSYSDHLTSSTNKYGSYYLDPPEGYFILFPSHIQHKVNENLSNEDRISISFNLQIT